MGQSTQTHGTNPSSGVTSPTVLGTSPTVLGTSPTVIGTFPTVLGTSPTMLGTFPTMLGTSPTVLGTSPIMLGTSPTMLGTSPTVLGTSPAGTRRASPRASQRVRRPAQSTPHAETEHCTPKPSLGVRGLLDADQTVRGPVPWLGHRQGGHPSLGQTAPKEPAMPERRWRPPKLAEEEGPQLTAPRHRPMGSACDYPTG